MPQRPPALVPRPAVREQTPSTPLRPGREIIAPRRREIFLAYGFFFFFPVAFRD